jgi:hypothetical protein
MSPEERARRALESVRDWPLEPGPALSLEQTIAAAVRAEREACAKLLDGMMAEEMHEAKESALRDAAAAIRSRP